MDSLFQCLSLFFFLGESSCIFFSKFYICTNNTSIFPLGTHFRLKSVQETRKCKNWEINFILPLKLLQYSAALENNTLPWLPFSREHRVFPRRGSMAKWRRHLHEGTSLWCAGQGLAPVKAPTCCQSASWMHPTSPERGYSPAEVGL